MSRYIPCIHYSVERVLVRVCLVVSCIFATQVFASSHKYIVVLKSQKEIHPLLRVFARAEALKNLTDRVNSQTNVKATALKEVNIMLAEGSKEEVEAAVANDPSVSYIEEDKVVKLAEADNYGALTTNSPYLNVLGLHSSSLIDPNTGVSAHLTTKPANDDPIIVAVVDTGANLTHPFLEPFLYKNTTTLAGYGNDHDGIGINSGNVITDDPSDVYDHGSHVTGLIKTVRDQAIAAGYAEAADVQVLPVRFFYNCDGSLCGTTSGAIVALDYALARGAKVINMSWGSQGSDSYSQALFDVMANLYSNNITLVAAAGNESADTDSDPFFPAASSQNIPGLISVASITTYHDQSTGDLQQLMLSSFSNFGMHTVDIAAPGSSEYLFSGLLSANAYFPSDSNEFVPKSGTSMASPIVAGIAAVVRAISHKAHLADPENEINAAEVKDLILQNATVPLDNNNVKILANTNRADGYANATGSFDAAKVAVSSGNALPSVSVSSYTGLGNSGNSGTAGGCGAITHPGSGGGNPFGGNSMGLLTFAFFMVQFMRRMRYKMGRC